MSESSIVTASSEHGNIEASVRYFLSQAIPTTARILDVGCYKGSLLHNLRRHGYQNIQGVDTEDGCIARGQQQYPDIADSIQQYDGERLSFDDETFDGILMFDVIEHIPKLPEFLEQNVYRCLRPGGMFIFQTPNKYFNIPWEVYNHKSLTFWRTFHPSLQTSRTLRKHLGAAGFDRVRFDRVNLYTPYNQQKVKRAFSYPGLLALKALSLFPVPLRPHIWGTALKPGK